MGECDQGLEPVADDVGGREFVFVREDFPSRIKPWPRVEGRRSKAGIIRVRFRLSTLDLRPSTDLQPSLHVLLHAFLGFEIFGDDDDGARGEKMMERGSKKWLGGRGDAGASQCAARRQTPDEVLPGGRLSDVSEPIACR